MPKEKQLGPGATYHDLGGDAPTVTIAGVTFEDGETVNLVDELGAGRAQPILSKLAGNHFFDVENSDADHDEARERVAAESGRERRKGPARKPTVKKSVAKRIAKEDAEDADTDKGDADGDGDDKPEGELPPDVDTPDAPMLENRPRLPRARRGS